MFKISEKVIYPGHGVAVVEEVVEKVVAGNSIKFFKLRFMYKEMTVLIPVNNAPHLAIRSLSSNEDVKNVFVTLSKTPERKLENIDFTPSGWNKRNKDYQSRIQGGTLADLAHVYRELMFVAKQKELSFGERNLLQLTEDLLAQEIEVVSKTNRDAVLRQIRTPFQEYVSFPTHDQRVRQSSASS